MSFNDLKRGHGSFGDLEQYQSIEIIESYTNKDLEKAFMKHTNKQFETKVSPSLLCAKNMGNMYCASLYFGLASLLTSVDSDSLVLNILCSKTNVY